jgi:CRISPR-associated protein Cas8b/Csh1 subtype I-B
LLRALYQPRLKTKGDQPVSRFLGAVQRVVYGHPFDGGEFFDAAMQHVREVLHEQQSQGEEPWLVLSVHQSLAVAFWLLELNLLSLAHIAGKDVTVGGSMMPNYPDLSDDDLNSRFDDFFAIFSGLFASEEQRAAYLMGVLCAQVLSAQRRRFDNRQPFFRNLKDLHMDETEIRGLLPKLKSKLVEYDIDHFNWGLEKSIGERFRRAGSPWKLTTSEINFFFTLGLCEAQLFAAKPRDKETNETEENNNERIDQSP